MFNCWSTLTNKRLGGCTLYIEREFGAIIGEEVIHRERHDFSKEQGERTNAWIPQRMYILIVSSAFKSTEQTIGY